MKRFCIIRDYKPEATIGRLLNVELGKELCKSLERPNLDNASNISCIPEGIYKVRKDDTGKFKYFKILDVEGRAAIEIHPANIVEELQGCIALGDKIIENQLFKGKKHKYFLTNSKATCDKLKADFEEKEEDEFELEITSVDSQCNYLNSLV